MLLISMCTLACANANLPTKIFGFGEDLDDYGIKIVSLESAKNATGVFKLNSDVITACKHSSKPIYYMLSNDLYPWRYNIYTIDMTTWKLISNISIDSMYGNGVYVADLTHDPVTDLLYAITWMKIPGEPGWYYLSTYDPVTGDVMWLTPIDCGPHWYLFNSGSIDFKKRKWYGMFENDNGVHHLATLDLKTGHMDSYVPLKNDPIGTHIPSNMFMKYHNKNEKLYGIAQVSGQQSIFNVDPAGVVTVVKELPSVLVCDMGMSVLDEERDLIFAGYDVHHERGCYAGQGTLLTLDLSGNVLNQIHYKKIPNVYVGVRLLD